MSQSFFGRQDIRDLPLNIRDITQTSGCNWYQGDGESHEGDDYVWESECGSSFIFNEDGPVENRFEVCPFCGGRLNSHYQDPR